MHIKRGGGEKERKREKKQCAFIIAHEGINYSKRKNQYLKNIHKMMQKVRKEENNNL